MIRPVFMPGVDCIQRRLREFPAQREMTEQGELVRGLLVRFALERLPGAPDASADSSADALQSEEGAYAELQLSDAARFYPSDAALARWRSQADAGRAVIAYD
jgi:DNA polymerase-3 subunit alpha